MKNNQQHTNDNKCRFCKVKVEDVTHIISSCSEMSSQYQMSIRQDVIAKYLYEAIIEIRIQNAMLNNTRVMGLSINKMKLSIG